MSRGKCGLPQRTKRSHTCQKSGLTEREVGSSAVQPHHAPKLELLPKWRLQLKQLVEETIKQLEKERGEG